MLQLSRLACGYGGRRVLTDVDLDVELGEILVVLGPNGAGKTTLLKTVAGVLPAIAGQLRLNGEVLTRASARKRFRTGIAWVPEGRRLFSDLTVEENLTIGLHKDAPDGWRDRFHQLIELFPVIGEYRQRPATALSGGQQQMVAIGRALVSGPRVLLLDEPSLGLAPKLVDIVMTAVKQLQQDQMAVVMVEQNVRAGLSVADRAVVVRQQTVGTPTDALALLHDDAIVQSYLAETS